MNPDHQETNSQQEAPPETADEQESAHRRTRTGKIARLPKAVRDKLNTMLLDGVPFAEILQNLGDAAKGITEQNITTWVPGGYREWLKQQQDLEKTRVKQEVAMDLACPEGGSKIHEASLQLAATQLTEIVRDFDFSEFAELLRADPAKLSSFLNSLARISDAELKCERHRIERDERASKVQQNQSAKAPGLSPQAKKLMENELNLM